MKKWFDENGMLHPEPQPSSSDNGVLFRGTYDFLKFKRGQLSIDDVKDFDKIIKLHQKDKGSYVERIDGPSKDSSHDNIVCMCTYSKVFDLEHHYNIKIIKNFNKLWHPRDWIYLAWLRGDLWAKLFLPVLWFIFVYMALTKYKTRPKFHERLLSGFTLKTSKRIKTDTEILFWQRLFVDSPFISFCKKTIVPLIKLKFGEDWEKFMFEDYYAKYDDHPVRVQVRKVYGE